LASQHLRESNDADAAGPKPYSLHTRSLHARPYLVALSTEQLTFQVVLQVLKDARAIDDKYAAGEDIKPLCGMTFTVKDNLDVIGIVPPKILMHARVFLKACPEGSVSWALHLKLYTRVTCVTSTQAIPQKQERQLCEVSPATRHAACLT
jgi:hypothetical protein